MSILRNVIDCHVCWERYRLFLGEPALFHMLRFAIARAIDCPVSASDRTKVFVDPANYLARAEVSGYDEELEKAKNTISSQYIFGRQSVHDKGEALAHAAVIHGSTTAADAEYDLFMKVSKEDIMRVSQKYFRTQNRTVLMITPGGGN